MDVSVLMCVCSEDCLVGGARLVVATLTLSEIEYHHPTSALCVFVKIRMHKSFPGPFLKVRDGPGNDL